MVKSAMLAAAIITFAGFSAAFAQTAARKGSADVAAKPALDLEDRWVAALTKPDIAALNAILNDTYVDTDESGARSHKSGVVAALESGELRLTSIKLSDEHVYRYGNAVVVTGVAEQSGAFQGHPIAPKILFTDTLVMQWGKWRAAASQRTAAPGP